MGIYLEIREGNNNEQLSGLRLAGTLSPVSVAVAASTRDMRKARLTSRFEISTYCTQSAFCRSEELNLARSGHKRIL